MTPAQTHLVQHLASIARLPEREQQQILARTRERVLQPGELFVRSGEPTTTIGYIADGWMRYYLTTADGREFTRYFCKSGHFVAPPEGPTGSTYSIRTLTRCTLLVLARDEWQALVVESAYWARITMATQEYALQLAEQRERSLVLSDATERYRELLTEHPSIEDHVKQYDIANYLGITPEALSRLRRRRARS